MNPTFMAMGATAFPDIRNVEKMCLIVILNFYTVVFRKRVANIVFLELGLVSNERSGNSTCYRDIHKFLDPSIMEEITV